MAADRAQVQAILAAHDRLQPAIEEYFASVAEDVLLLPNGAAAVEGKAAYRRNVEAFYASAGNMRIRHDIVDLHAFSEVVIVRGRAVGTVEEPGQTPVTAFETKNLFVFRRTSAGKLQVWQIIFNDTPRAP
jgi:ketosteroid isomerase-like protein